MEFGMVPRQQYFRTPAKNQSNRLNIKNLDSFYKRVDKINKEKTSTSNERTEQRAVTKFCAKAEMTPTDT